MAVFRIEKTRDYTVMSNYHLRDMSLSLKAKGLLSLMLSLPENWDYTMKGLARICKDGIDSISGGIRELEAHGYLVRARIRGANGQLGSIEYTILEQPKTPSPTQEKPIRENPVQANPMLDAPIQENPAKLNKEESSNYPSKTDLSITQESSPILSSPPVPSERSGQDGMRKRESYRALILENIEYDVLSQNVQLDKDRLDELVELMVDTVCSNREMIRVAGDDYPAEVVRSRFLKLNASHIEYVLDRMRENTTYVRNIKKYLLAALYNAPVTMDSYYTSLSAMTCTAAEIGGECLAGRNHAENSWALCGGQQNDRPALAAGHEEGAGRYGESQEKSPTPARQADAPAAYEAQHRRLQHRDHGSEYPGLFFHGEEVRPGFCAD